MYMLVQPQWLGNVKCDVARHINIENLFVQNPYAFLLGKEREGLLLTKTDSFCAMCIKLLSRYCLRNKFLHQIINKMSVWFQL